MWWLMKMWWLIKMWWLMKMSIDVVVNEDEYGGHVKTPL